MKYYLSDTEFNLFSTLIYDQSGIHFSHVNRSILESRLKDRLRVLKIDKVTDYYQFLIKHQDEMKTLLDLVTTNLTRFFRNNGHFQAFEKHVLKKIVEYKKKTNNNHIQVWSAGCSTGEEPYSIAMVMKEKLPSHIKIEITGSDLSLKSLMISKGGFYPENRVTDIPEYYLKKYFEKKREGYQVKDEIRDCVKFDYHNLKFDSGLNNMDVVFCRNVIIYFDAAAQKATIGRIYREMSEYSFLFIGHSESLFGMNTDFKFIKTEWATLYQKNSTGMEF
ncbi:MAG: protein-glutamate O-methyltransferase CheR [Spirochaetales bacterium]|nr:protein-glutamate O-methyltransferase CheR [Spirochaetales bacterium]